jgi:hypothetical protein
VTPPPTAANAARVRGATAVPAPLRLPPAPRRVSGPARRERVVAPPSSGASALLIRLIDHPWLERLIRGRAWIAIVATALLGIVAMQVALLRLGAQIGGETAAVNSLQQRNSSMEATIGGLEASSGLGTSPHSLGMLYPPPGAVTYLQLNPGDARLAADRIQSPTAAALAAAAAHPPRPVVHHAAAKTVPATADTGAVTAPPSTGATGAGASATSAGTVVHSATMNTSGASTTAAANTAGTTPTSGNATTPTTATTPDTTPTTSLTGGAAATSPAGGTTAPAGTTSGAAVTGG